MADNATPQQNPLPPHGFCHRCGSAYSAMTWPRSCGSCGNQTYQNPQPVSVCFTPVHDGEKMIGFVGVLRGLADGFGKWAPFGGYSDMRESLEAAAQREGVEESGLSVSGVRLQMSLPTPGSQLLVFSLSNPIHADELAKAVPQAGEILEVGLLTRGQPLAFPLHEQAMEALWEKAEQLVQSHLAAVALSAPQTRRPTGPR